MSGGELRSRGVKLDEVTVFYGEVVGLSRVSLELEPGVTGIVGPNGSGKSTLMKVMTGLIAPVEGKIEILGGNPFSDPDVRKRISFVPALECFHQTLSGKRNLEVVFMAHGHSGEESRRLAVQALEISGLTKDGKRRYGTWSRGMRQRLKLGLALVGETQVVLLDEPFLGVDPPSRRFLRGLIRQLGDSGRTVLVSSHVLHEVEALTDRVGILAHGRLLGYGRIDRLLRELRDRHPHRIRLEADNVRRLAEALIAREYVSEVRLVKADCVEFVTSRPESSYHELPALVSETGVLIRVVETHDNGLEAVFRHITAAGSQRL
ncbi:MAG: ABC transporter ATP-binding protein [bacterium]|nr:ABC transporter ATP-binding protein [bacterium]